MIKYPSTILRKLGLLFLVISSLTCVNNQREIPITTNWDDARRFFLEGRQKFENIRQDEARKLFSQAIEMDPDFALAHLYRAFTSTSEMGFQKLLQQAVDLAPKASEGERLMIEAVKAAADDQAVKAMELWELLVQKHPGDKRAHWYLGSIYFNRDLDDQSIDEFKKAIEIDHDYAPAYNFLGYVYMEKGDYSQSENAFKNYIDLIPDEANPYDSLGDLYTKMGKNEDAIESYNKAIARNPLFSFSQRKIGTNLVFMGRYDEGREAYLKALEMETSPREKLMDMMSIAGSYLYEGKYEEASVEADKVLEIAVKENLPEWQVGIHTGRCRVYIELGDLNAAEKCLVERKKVVVNSTLSPAIKEYYARGEIIIRARIAAKGKKFDEAMSLADEYKIKIEAGNDPKQMENYHELLGYIYFEKGDYIKAIENLKQANQDDPYTLYVLAVSESELGNKELAMELFKKVAYWNEDSLSYVLVRSKALKAIKTDIAKE